MNRLRFQLPSFGDPAHSLAARFRKNLTSTAVILALILAVALALRLNGLNWDDGFGFHPDERDIYMRSDCMYQALANHPGFENCGYLQAQPETTPGLPSLEVFLDPERSPLNPHWFPLGSVLLYVLVYFRSIFELVTDFSSMDMRYAGRAISALADVGSVFLVFLLGRRIYGVKIGLLAAGLTALAVIHIQNSHFYRPETFSALFTLASFWAIFRMTERKRFADSLLLGVFAGLAVAPKISGIVVLCPVGLAYGYRLWDAVRSNRDQDSEAWLRIVAHGAAALAGGLVVFALTSPYALLDFAAFKDDLTAQGHMVRNAGVWPFTIQYVGTAPYLYHIQQTAVWGLGLPLGIVAWLAVPLTVATLFWTTGRFRADSIILVFVLVTLVVQESFEVRFQRYLFTLMPLMILLGSRMLWWPVERFGGQPVADSGRRQRRMPRTNRVMVLWRRRRETLKWAAVGTVVFVVAATAFYALAFQRVYERQHPAVTASQWINGNIAPGTAIISDNHWDEFVPNLYTFDVWQYPVYETDTQVKMETLAGRLADSEYLVFYSNRPYSSVSRDPNRFPNSARYYELLFAGDLGYKLEQSFHSYPGLWGVEFRDDPIGAAGLPQPKSVNSAAPGALSFNLGYADDNVVGYDHPLVLLFRNIEGRPFEELVGLLAGGPSPDGVQWERKAGPGGLMLSEADLLTQRNGGTWSELISRDSWTNRLPVLAWLLAVELVFLAALPLSIFVFRPLPDRGIILARILGLLLVSYIAWMAVSLGWVEFSKTAIVWGFLALCAASGLALAVLRREIVGFLRERWRFLLGAEMLFLLAFLAFVLVRAANPDLWHPWRGGEKPMELAYFSAVIKSSIMPPFDPWFSGGYLNYYYWGYFMPAALVRITGILPTTAFNLAVPLFFALTVTAAFSLVYNAAQGVHASRRGGRRPSPGRRGGPWWSGFRSPVAAGLLGAAFVGVIGNLDGAVQVVRGLWHKLFETGGYPAFDFWRSSRVIPAQENFDPSPLAFWVPDKVAGVAETTPHITEFPFFTFLFADLHAHMMVIPYYLLVLALGMNLAVGLRRQGLRWISLAAATLALALGSLWVINSWDYPTFGLLALGLVVVGVYLRPGSDQHRARLAVSLLLLVGAGSIVAFLPFHQAYETFNSGLEPTKWHTPLMRYLWIHGLFLFIAGTFVLWQIRGGVARLYSSIRGGRIPRLSNPSGRLIVLAAGFGLAVLMAAAGFWTPAVLLLCVLGVGWVGWTLIPSNREDRAFALMPLIWLAMGLGISIGVDFIRVTGDIGRMNTLFKYYLEVWVLFGLAGAYFLWLVIDSGALRRLAPPVRWVWTAALVVLLGSSLIYTVLGTRVRLADRFEPAPLTLDGTAYMNTATHSELEKPFQLEPDLRAIEWLQDNVEGSPVVLEAHGDQYRWNGRISIYTGLPTVLGWPWHQIQQRTDYSGQVGERARDVATIYNTNDLQLAGELLQRYQVEYIVIGELERIYYDAPGLDKFLAMEQRGRLRRVYESSGVIIFRAIPS